MFYFFLRQKNRVTYQRALEVLFGAESNLLPGSVLRDFEKTFHFVLQDVFRENINVKGCYFYHAQSIWQHIQDENSVDIYRENDAL